MKGQDSVRNTLRYHRMLAGGFTQEALAERAGVSRQTILAIEKGNYSPSVGLALRLASILGVSVEALFQLEEGSGHED